MGTAQRLFTIDATTSETPWFDSSTLVESFMFQGKKSSGGVLTVAMEVANDAGSSSAPALKNDAVEVESWTDSFAKIAEEPLPRYFRFVRKSHSSGSFTISIGRGRNQDGQLADISPQSWPTTIPSGEFAS